MKLTEHAHFRLIVMPCCHSMFCWVNPRLPNYCPECGVQVYAKLKADGSHIRVSDNDARLIYNSEK